MAIDLFSGGGGEDYSDVPLVSGSSSTSQLLYQHDLFHSSAALSAGSGVWETVLDVTGAKGVLRGAMLYSNSVATSQSLTLKITIDGVEFEKAQVTGGSAYVVGIHTAAVTQNSASPRYIYPLATMMHRFRQSLKIEVKRSSGSTVATAAWTHSLDR